MCDFKDFPIISRYTLKQALEDGLLIKILDYNGKPVVCPSHLKDHFGTDDLYRVFYAFKAWDKDTRPTLPEEEQLFSTIYTNRKIWVIENEEAYTIMYPEDY
jgi:hypothetical protein